MRSGLGAGAAVGEAGWLPPAILAGCVPGAGGSLTRSGKSPSAKANAAEPCGRACRAHPGARTAAVSPVRLRMDVYVDFCARSIARDFYTHE